MLERGERAAAGEVVNTTKFYGLIKLDVICQAISRNPAEQKVGADGMALNLSTFVYLAYRQWRYMHSERELVNKSECWTGETCRCRSLAESET